MCCGWMSLSVSARARRPPKAAPSPLSFPPRLAPHALSDYCCCCFFLSSQLRLACRIKTRNHWIARHSPHMPSPYTHTHSIPPAGKGQASLGGGAKARAKGPRGLACGGRPAPSNGSTDVHPHKKGACGISKPSTLHAHSPPLPVHELCKDVPFVSSCPDSRARPSLPSSP